MSRKEEDFEYKSMEDPVAASLAQIKYFEQALEALHFAVRAGNRGDGNQHQAEFNGLHRAIYEKLHDAYRQFFMWGNFVGGEVQKKAIKMAQDKFLHDQYSIMSYLQSDGGYRGGHYEDDEQEFKADLKELAIAKGALDPVAARTECPKCFAPRGRSCRDKNYKKIPNHKERNVASIKTEVHPGPEKK